MFVQDINTLMTQIEASDPTRSSTRKTGRRSKVESEWIRQHSVTASRSATTTWDIDPTLPPIVFVYERISDLKEDSVTFERQRAGITDLAKREGIDLTNAIFLGEEGSAFQLKHRPEFDKMIKTIEAFKGRNQIIVIASELSRLFRNREVAVRVMSVLRSKKVKLKLCNNPSLDILDKNFDMVLSVLIEMSQGEGANTQYRATGAHQVRAARGEYRGGGVPFGMVTEKRETPNGLKSFLKINRETNPNYPAEIVVGMKDGVAIKEKSHILCESDLVKEMYAKSSRGDNLTDIAVWLNACGFPTAASDTSSWSQTVVRRILSNPHYTGRVVYKSKVVKDANGNDLIINEQFIDDDTFALVQARLDSRYRVSGTRRSYKLSGLLFCGECDSRMSGRPGNSTTNRSYGCKWHYLDKTKCTNPNFINTDNLEKFFYDMLSELAETKPEMLVSLGTREEVVDQNAEKRAELTLKLKDLEAKIEAEQDALTKEGLRHMRNIVSKQIVEIEQDAYAATVLAKVAFEGAAQFKQAWDSNNRTHLMLAMRTIIDKIVILPTEVTGKMNWVTLKKLNWPVNLNRVVIHWANGTVMNMGQVQITE